MIVARAPLRISVTGGGTDLPAFAERVGGHLMSVAIDKYVSVIVHRPVADDLVRAKYGRVEEVERVDDLRHELIRPVLRQHGLHSGIEILSCADVPAGTGLGSSGAFLVALLAAVKALTGGRATPHELAREAVRIEQREAQRPVGFQDPFLAAYGGLRRLTTRSGSHVEVSADLAAAAPVAALGWLRLYYTGIRRESTPVLREVQRSYAAETEAALHQQLTDATHAEKAFLDGDLDAFSDYVNESWRRKRMASAQASSAWIEDLLRAARDSGASAGKVTGAGGGGFVLLVVPPVGELSGRLDRRMAELGAQPVRFAPAHDGVRVTPVGTGAA
jgi:D-glycero-alpha-D-manno-heptose-7-phosphate kinase